jgi:hypothetical protein
MLDRIEMRGVRSALVGLAVPGLVLGGCLPPIDGAPGGGAALFSVSDGKGDGHGGWEVEDDGAGLIVVDRLSGEPVLDVAPVGDGRVVRITLSDGSWAEVDHTQTVIATTIVPSATAAARYRAIGDAFGGPAADDKGDGVAACQRTRAKMMESCAVAIATAAFTVVAIFSGVGTVGGLALGGYTAFLMVDCEVDATIHRACVERNGG